MLREAGYRQRSRRPRTWTCLDVANDVEFFYLRPRDIAAYVGSGDPGPRQSPAATCSSTPARRRRSCIGLGFGGAAFRFAGPLAMRGVTDAELADLAGRRIATAYAGSGRPTTWRARGASRRGDRRARRCGRERVRLGVADVIADVVETGATLRPAGLERSASRHRSSPGGAGQPRHRRGPEPARSRSFRRRLHGVLVARRYVMLAYDSPPTGSTEAVALTPGIESRPCCRCTARAGSRCRRWSPRGRCHRDSWTSSTTSAPARILVTDIHACRL